MQQEPPLTAAQIANYTARAASEQAQADLYNKAMGGQQQEDPVKARMRQELMKGK